MLLLSGPRAMWGGEHPKGVHSPPGYFAQVIVGTKQGQDFAPVNCTQGCLVQVVTLHLHAQPLGNGAGKAGSQLNPAAPVCRLLSLFQVTVDPGIAFPICRGDGLFSRREQKLKCDGGCCSIRLLGLSFFITIPATCLVGNSVML